MKNNTKLTTVIVLEETYKKFKINIIEGTINLQKLVNRSMDLYNNNKEFRDKVDTHKYSSPISGSKY
jgi:hypothetical protein